MSYLLKGAMIEYGSSFLGPLPNVVLFQFNPDKVRRTIDIPPRDVGASSRETSQVGEVPLEKYDMTVKFSAADMLGEENVLAKLAGVGPQLAALEMMVRPVSKLSGAIGAAIDAIASAISGGDEEVTQPIPREEVPRLLFIWGLTRVLPVSVHSMSITETHYDRLLNPIEAEVQLGLTVLTPDPCAGDDIAEGALSYSLIAKEVLAASNLANTVGQAAEMMGDVTVEIAF